MSKQQTAGATVLVTREDVEALKRGWLRDPCFDLEDYEGFEAYRDELLTFRQEQEARWAAEDEARLQRIAANLGTPGNVALADYVRTLESRIEQLAQQVKGLEAYAHGHGPAA